MQRVRARVLGTSQTVRSQRDCGVQGRRTATLSDPLERPVDTLPEIAGAYPVVLRGRHSIHHHIVLDTDVEVADGTVLYLASWCARGRRRRASRRAYDKVLRRQAAASTIAAGAASVEITCLLILAFFAGDIREEKILHFKVKRRFS